MSGLRQNTYSREFKVDAVRRYAFGIESMTQIENELGIGSGLLSKWRTIHFEEALAPTDHVFLMEPLPVQNKPQNVILATSILQSIWTEKPIDPVEWVQFYGHTRKATKDKYHCSEGVHTGIDWGVYSNRFNPSAPPKVIAGCIGEVIKIDANSRSYMPGWVRIRPQTHPHLEVIYGHLQNIQVESGGLIRQDTVLGFLEPIEHHVHIEIRRTKDNRYLNPYPYLSPTLKRFLNTKVGNSKGTTYDANEPNPAPNSGKYIC